MEGSFVPKEQIIWPLSVFFGIVMCIVVYEVTRKVSMVSFKGYNNLTKLQKIEWNNRGFSTFHAVVAAAFSFYLLVLSDLFKGGSEEDFLVYRKSLLSDAMFGISLGYFLSDLAMILWLFPSLGGKEYILHHGLSLYAISVSLVLGYCWAEEFKYICLQWCGSILLLAGKNNVPPGVLQHSDSTSNCCSDECGMVLENLQGHGEDSL